MSSYIQNEKDVLIDVDDDLLHSATRDLSVSSCAIAMLFGTIIFTTVTLAARLWLVGLWSWEGGGMPIAPSMAALELSGSSSQSAHMDRNSEKSQPLDTTSRRYTIYSIIHRYLVLSYCTVISASIILRIHMTRRCMTEMSSSFGLSWLWLLPDGIPFDEIRMSRIEGRGYNTSVLNGWRIL